MNVFYAILAFGVGAGLLAVAIAIFCDRLARGRQRATAHLNIPRSYGLNGSLNPGALMSRWGSDAAAHQSLGTVVMRPTFGIKAFGIAMIGLMLFAMWGAHGAAFRHDAWSLALVAGTMLYLILFLSLYEVSYDSEGVTLPGWLFRRRTYLWADLISIKQTDDVTYTLRFETGKARVRKFLVGMPTFLTFVTEVREMNSRP